MKIWYGYGSEHSANLVMIGHFEDASKAAESKNILDLLADQVREDEKKGLIKFGGNSDHYTDRMLELLGEVKIYSINPLEVEHFAYDYNIKVEDKDLIITTEELDISALFKVLIDKGARVEIYSAHLYADTKYGRGK